jgi:hypothetical protein
MFKTLLSVKTTLFIFNQVLKYFQNTFKCENDTPSILYSVENNTFSVFLINASVIWFRHSKVSVFK